jgi:hypothetical protein
VHLRRALLLFALVLGLTALATSISPSPRSTAPRAPSPPAAAPHGATSAAGIPGVRNLAFHAPPGRRAPAVQAVAGQHLLVSVSSTLAGQASIPALGRTATVQPGTPATFDLVLPASGRYDVLYTPALGGASRRVGTVVAGD